MIGEEMPNENNIPLFAQDIDSPAPWEPQWGGSPAEVYDAFRHGKYGAGAEPMSRDQALNATQFHFSPAFKGIWDPKWSGSYPMPNWNPNQYDEFSKKVPMSELDTVLKLLKAG